VNIQTIFTLVQWHWVWRTLC